MKTIVVLLQSALLLTTYSFSIPENKDDFHIFLLMGQSNMEGGAPLREVGDMDKATHPRVYKLNSQIGWILATDPITENRDIAVGPGLAFAKRLVAEDENISVGLVPLAMGGTSIAQWARGTELYQSVLDAVAIARDKGVIKGILWHQGEHDTFGGTGGMYAENLFNLIDDLRRDLRDPYLPFIAGQLTFSPEHTESEDHRVVMRRIFRVGQEGYLTGYVDSKSDDPDTPLYYEENQIHFTSDGMRVMGNRYAEEYLRVSGRWRSKLKETLDEEAIVDEDTGWKWHESFGFYWDLNFPFIKQKQMGWLKIDAYSDGTAALETPTNGSFRSLTDDWDIGWYIYREIIDSSDPVQVCTKVGDIFLVNLISERNDELIFYDHQKNEWFQEFEAAPLLTELEDFYFAAEKQFLKTQQYVAQLKQGLSLYQMGVYLEEVNKWYLMSNALRGASDSRVYTILLAQEAYFEAFKSQNNPLRDFWLMQTIGLINRIDGVFIEGQQAWAEYTNLFLSN